MSDVQAERLRELAGNTRMSAGPYESLNKLCERQLQEQMRANRAILEWLDFYSTLYAGLYAGLSRRQRNRLYDRLVAGVSV